MSKNKSRTINGKKIKLDKIKSGAEETGFASLSSESLAVTLSRPRDVTVCLPLLREHFLDHCYACFIKTDHQSSSALLQK